MEIALFITGFLNIIAGFVIIGLKKDTKYWNEAYWKLSKQYELVCDDNLDLRHEKIELMKKLKG